MKKIAIGWLSWLTEENFARRHRMVEESARSLSIIKNDVSEIIVLNNGELTPHLPEKIKTFSLGKNYYDVAIQFFSYLYAREQKLPYFAFAFDDFLFYKDSFQDAVEFMDKNEKVSCMRLTRYETNNRFFNSQITAKSINPEAVSHLEGAGDSIVKTPLRQTGPIDVGNTQFYLSNWRPISRPTLWRTKAYENFVDFSCKDFPVMQSYEARMHSIADRLGVNNLYESAYIEGGICCTYPTSTSERERTDGTHWAKLRINMTQFHEDFKKSLKKNGT